MTNPFGKIVNSNIAHGPLWMSNNVTWNVRRGAIICTWNIIYGVKKE